MCTSNLSAIPYCLPVLRTDDFPNVETGLGTEQLVFGLDEKTEMKPVENRVVNNTTDYWRKVERDNILKSLENLPYLSKIDDIIEDDDSDSPPSLEYPGLYYCVSQQTMDYLFSYDIAKPAPLVCVDNDNPPHDSHSFPVIFSDFKLFCIVEQNSERMEISHPWDAWKTNLNCVKRFIWQTFWSHQLKEKDLYDKICMENLGNKYEKTPKFEMIIFRRPSTGTKFVKALMKIFGVHIGAEETYIKDFNTSYLRTIHCHVTNFKFVTMRLAAEYCWSEATDDALGDFLMTLSVPRHQAFGWIL